MFDQTFAISDIPRLILLIFLEIVLSIDNALILGTIVKKLPSFQQKKALFIGSASAIIFRILTITSISYLIHISWIVVLGGIYLIYLSISHTFFSSYSFLSKIQPKKLWQIIVLVEITDILFSLDSILSGVALISPGRHSHVMSDKLWIVYIGGIIGLIFMRAAAQFVITLMNKYPLLTQAAHWIIGWIGCKLLVQSFYGKLPIVAYWIFWIGIIVCMLIAFIKKEIKQTRY